MKEKWKIFLIGIGFLLIATAPTQEYYLITLLMGISVLILSYLLYRKGKNNK